MEVVSLEAIVSTEIVGVVSSTSLLILIGILGKKECKEGEEGSVAGIGIVVSKVQWGDTKSSK